MDIKILGQQIKAIRIEAGLSQEELAENIGTKRSNISRIETGKQNLSFKQILIIARALNREVTEEIFIKKN